MAVIESGTMPNFQDSLHNAPIQFMPTPRQYTYAPSPELPAAVTPGEEEERSAFTKGLLRGVDETQALLAAGAGAIGDVVGWDFLRDLGWEEYQAQMEEAAQYELEVGQIENIDSVGDFFTWVAEVAGGLAPSVGVSVLSGGVGGIAGKMLGKKVLTELADPAVKRALANEIKKNVVAGMSGKAAKQAAVAELVRSTAQKGAAAGLVGSSSWLESGSNWADDATSHGIDNTSAFQDIAFGVASGLTDLVGAEGSLIKKFLGRPIPNSVAKKVDDTIKKQFIKGIAKGALQEGSQEWTQETLAIVNSMLLDYRTEFNEEDLSRMVNAFAAGAVGGSLMSVPGTMRDRFLAGKVLEENEVKMNRTTTPTLEQAAEYEQATTDMGKYYEDNVKPQIKQEGELVINSLQEEKNVILRAMVEAKSAGDVEAVNDFQRALATVSGKIAKEKKSLAKKLQSYDSILDKASKYGHKQLESAIKSDMDEMVGRPKYLRKHTDTPFGQEHKHTITRLESFVNNQFAAQEARKAEIHRRLAEAERVSVLEGKDIYDTAQKNAAALRKAFDAEQEYTNRLLDTAEKAVRMVQYEGLENARTKSAIDELMGLSRSPDPVASAISLETMLNDNAREINARRREQDKRLDRRNEREEERAIKQLYFEEYLEERDNKFREDTVRKQEESRMLGEQLKQEQQFREMMEREEAARQMALEAEFRAVGSDQFLGRTPQITRPTQALTTPEREFFHREDMRSFPNIIQDDFLDSFRRAVPEEEVATPSLITPVRQEGASSRQIETHKPIIERRTRGFQADKESSSVPRVSGYISNLLAKLPVIKDLVTVVRNVDDERIPSEIRASLGKGWKAAYDTKTGRIYIFAENIADKQDAVRAVIHEAVGHMGLRAIFSMQGKTKEDSEQALKQFLNLVYGTFAGTKKWQSLISKNKDYESLTELQQAEEYIARLAERARVGQALSENEKTVWKKFKSLVKSLLHKLGIIKLTDKDITDVITASIHFLANESNVKQLPRIVSDSDVLRVRASAPYRAWVGKMKDAADDAADYAKTWKITKKSINEDGTLKKHDRGEQALEALADRMRRLQVTQRAIIERGGNIDSKADAYVVEELSHNKISEMIGKFREEFINGPNGIVTLVTKVIRAGESKDDAFNRCSRLAYAVHAFERNLHMERRSNGKIKDGSGLTNAQAFKVIEEIGVAPNQREAFRKAIAEGKLNPNNILAFIKPEHAAIIKRMADLSNYRLDLMVKKGMLHPGIAENWKRSYNFYVSLNEHKKEQLLIEPNYKALAGNKNFNIGKWDPVKWALGTTKEVENPVLNTILQAEDTVRNVGRVDTGRALLKMIEDNPEQVKDIFQLENAETRRTIVERSDNGDLVIKRPYAKFNQKVSESELITVVDEKGTHVRIWVKDPALARALRGENVQRAHKLVKAIGKVTRMLAVVNTTYSPDFLLSNPVRDLGSALLNVTEAASADPRYKLNHREMGAKILKDWRQSRKAIWNVLRGKKTGSEWESWFKEYQENGAFTQMYGQHDFESLHKELDKQIKRSSGDGIINGTFHYLGAAKDWVHAMSDSLENSARLAVFKNFAESYMAKGMGREEALQRAASVALNITVNFTRKGGASPILSSLYAFANASMQANLRLLRTIFHDKKRAAKMVGMFAGGTVMLAMLNREIGGEDEDGVAFYDKIPSWIRNGNLIFMSPFGDGSYIKIPLPYGYHLFNVLGQVIDQSVQGKTNPAAGALELIKASFGNFSPIGDSDEGWTMFVPTALRPFAQIQTNANFFGQPIRPEQQFYHKGEFPDSEKYWSGCNKVAIAIAQGLNFATFGSESRAGVIDISPETLEHIWESYLGGAGKTVSRVTELAFKAAIGDEITPNDFPVVRRFIGEDNYYQTLPFYSKTKLEIETQLNEYKSAKEQGKLTPDVVKSTLKGRALANSLKSAQEQLKKLGEAEKTLASLPASVASERRRQLRERREAVMKRLIKQANDKGL